MDVFLTSIFQIGLLPYFHLATISMKRDILISIKKVVVICEESGLITIRYNFILTTPNINTIAKTIVSNISTKSLLICINF